MSEFSGVDSFSAGDILLYSSTSKVGWAICLLDGTEVSHAGLYLGNGIVGEALVKDGLTQQAVDKSIQGCKWVKVFRLNNLPADMQPVLAKAKHYLDEGNRYGYEQILLLAGICLMRKLDIDNPVLRRLVRAAMCRAVDLIGYLHREGKEPMICSEFVFRTYDEALLAKDDPYSLKIHSQTVPEPRRRFSWIRRRMKLLSGETQPEATSIHPDSLLAQLQALGDTPEALLASNKMAKAMPEPEEDLDSLIEQYLAESEGIKAAGPPAVAAGPKVSKDDLLDSARRLAAELAEVTVCKAKIENKLYGVREGIADTAPMTFADILADFVTPGDLLKSPSLTEVEMIRP